MKIAKVIHKGKEYFVEVLKVGSVLFDPKPGWALTRDIDKIARKKDVMWFHPDTSKFVWIRDFHF